jgi:hypothetical protein
MPLLNYRTGVPASRTASEVQALLVKAGARGIAMEYNADRRLIGMSFAVPTAYGTQTFVLPVDARRVQAVLERQKVDRQYRTPDHAERVAWRIVKDWVEAQLALLSTEMVSLDQLMLPYMAAGDSTVYERYVHQQLAIGAGGDSGA